MLMVKNLMVLARLDKRRVLWPGSSSGMDVDNPQVLEAASGDLSACALAVVFQSSLAAEKHMSRLYCPIPSMIADPKSFRRTA
jgi:hypothetical protein